MGWVSISAPAHTDFSREVQIWFFQKVKFEKVPIDFIVNISISIQEKWINKKTKKKLKYFIKSFSL